MKTALLFMLLFALHLESYSIEITGRITDVETGNPVEYTAVYINGSTIGTTTDTLGRFSLAYNFDHCRIVINHVSYKSAVLDISPEVHRNLDIKLEPKNIEMTQVLVQSQNLRKKSMAYFKKNFLGNNFWGENAEILNDSVLFFHTEYFGADAPDSALVGKRRYFVVQATAPLLIDLPKLGYLLQYDMVQFVEAYDSIYKQSVIKNLGYTYFREYDDVSRLQELRFRRNRYKVYYHSVMHFVRSLYENKLEQNGYDVYVITRDSNTTHYNLFYADSIDISFKNDEAAIMNLQGTELLIQYYTNNFKPINLERYEGDDNWRILAGMSPAAYSVLYIEKDTCILRKDGTLPGGELLFDGDIADKRYGAILPSDFKP
ncbi:carboxypeptidase-like regulatory domain-containing protein [Saccharicrinis sp. FJH54]|uniref:carboxypeptidase-like regulatory domain-containing protein n=1 Tax=Saccharicrinis sp. FJH54 TaxID=3344665 RepID=UPI0035D41AE7